MLYAKALEVLRFDLNADVPSEIAPNLTLVKQKIHFSPFTASSIGK